MSLFFSTRKLFLYYLVIWALSLLIFWVFLSPSDALGFSLVFLWIVIPVLTFVISFFIGKGNLLGHYKWLSCIGFGAMYMLLEYLTFSLANNIAFDKINAPVFSLLLAGAVISLIGMEIGAFIYRHKKKESHPS
ncbi:MAG: hypothetical protein K6G01_06500 [Eubacterium sp.]|nr:hypothetical protein [Eubacterium sp.]